MAYAIAKKLSSLVVTLLGIALVAFALLRLIPGDPVLVQLGERGASPEAYQEMKAQMGLDQPLHRQFINYISSALQGELGRSFITREPVAKEFFGRFPATLELGASALLFAIALGIPLGIVAALARNRWPDRLLMATSLAGYSMPIFWWGLILILFFSVHLGLTPVSGRIATLYELDGPTGFYLIDSLQANIIAEEGLAPFFSVLRHLILPALALGTVPLALIARMTRSSMLEVLSRDYIRMAKAKGLPPWRVVGLHALRNALIPIVTVTGLMFGQIITGAILTETIFSWPGVGKWIVASVIGLDYKAVQGGVLLIGTAVVAVNTLVDILYALVNPQMR